MYPTKDDFYGFIFYYEDGDLSQPESCSKKEISALPQDAGNRDSIYIFCNRCDRYMRFSGAPEALDGEWSCPECGASVPEFEPYDILEDMNRNFEKEWLSDDDDF